MLQNSFCNGKLVRAERQKLQRALGSGCFEVFKSDSAIPVRHLSQSERQISNEGGAGTNGTLEGFEDCINN